MVVWFEIQLEVLHDTCMWSWQQVSCAWLMQFSSAAVLMPVQQLPNACGWPALHLTLAAQTTDRA